MRIYIASSFEEAPRLRQWRDAHFPSYNLISASSWLDIALVEPPLGHSDDHRRAMADLDIGELLSSDALVVFNEHHLHGRGRGGRHVELGIALGRNAALPDHRPMQIIAVGPRENVFHYHSTVTTVPDGDAALTVLDDYHRSVLRCCS